MKKLQVATKYYDLVIEKAKLIKRDTNQIYECEDKILQFTSKAYKSSEEIGMELAFINYLRSKNISVVEVIPSKYGNLFEVLEQNLLICYKKIKGVKINKDLWNEQHFYRLGKLTGKLHKFGKNFANNSDFKFKHWYEIPKSKINADLPIDDRNLAVLHKQLLQYFSSYSISKDNYGLLHYDIHHGNYLIEKDRNIVLFDFEMMCQSWYAHEIGNVLYYALLIPKMREEKGKEEWFLHHFLDGYLREHPLANEELSKIPKYLLYRDLLVYAYICKIWKEEEITTKNRAYKEQIANSIEKRRKNLGL